MNDARQAVDLTLVKIELDTHFVHNFPFGWVLLHNFSFDKVTVARFRDIILCFVNQPKKILSLNVPSSDIHRYQDIREHS